MLFLRSVTLRILTFYDAIMIVVLVKSHENDVSCFVTGCFYKFTIADFDFLQCHHECRTKILPELFRRQDLT